MLLKTVVTSSISTDISASKIGTFGVHVTGMNLLNRGGVLRPFHVAKYSESFQLVLDSHGANSTVGVSRKRNKIQVRSSHNAMIQQFHN